MKVGYKAPFGKSAYHCQVMAQPAGDNVQYMYTTTGSVGLVLEPTRMAVHFSNSVGHLFQVKKDLMGDQIQTFPLTVSSHRQPRLFSFTAFSGTMVKKFWNKSFTWGREITTPYYYSVRLQETEDNIEFAPSARSCFFRLQLKKDQSHFIRINSINNPGKITLTCKRVITGREAVLGLPAFFYAEVVAGFTNADYIDTLQKQLLLRFPGAIRSLGFRYGIAFINNKIVMGGRQTTSVICIF